MLGFLRINPEITSLFLGSSDEHRHSLFLRSRSYIGTAGVILIIAGLLDMVDGMVARNTQSETPFGAFFDSVMDRYSDSDHVSNDGTDHLVRQPGSNEAYVVLDRS